MNLKTLKIYFILISQISILSCSSGSSAPTPEPKPPSSLPNGAICTSHSHCSSKLCCGEIGHGSTCEASCPAPPRQALDFCNAGERPMLVTNNSTKPLWVGLTGGTFFCLKDSDCEGAGSNCAITGENDSGPLGICSCKESDTSCGTLGGCAISTVARGPYFRGLFECHNIEGANQSCSKDADCGNGGTCTIQSSASSGVCSCTTSPKSPTGIGCGNIKNFKTCSVENPVSTTKYTICAQSSTKPYASSCKDGNTTPCSGVGGECILNQYPTTGHIKARGVCAAKSAANCTNGGIDGNHTHVDNNKIITKRDTLFSCFWNHPRYVDAKTPELKLGESLKMCFPVPTSTKQNSKRTANKTLSAVQWSGNLFARFGCDANGQNCDSGDCSKNVAGPDKCPNKYTEIPSNNNQSKMPCGPLYTGSEKQCPNNGYCAPQDGSCILGKGGEMPTTLAEFTIMALTKSKDYYDVSIINGINIGISMAPDPVTTTTVNPANTSTTIDHYFCGIPGATKQAGSQRFIKDCSWGLDLTKIPQPKISNKTATFDASILLRQVKAPNNTVESRCSSGTDCTSPEVCGLSQNITVMGKPLTQFTKVCGKPVAYWSADQLVTTLKQPATSDDTAVLLPLKTNTEAFDKFGCTGGSGPTAGSTSCYQDVTTCNCGCPTISSNPYVTSWPKVASGAGNCTVTDVTDPGWTDIVQPWLVWMKQACPTAYTFPFDDKTSTFTCAPDTEKGAKTDGSAPGYYVNLFDVTEKS